MNDSTLNFYGLGIAPQVLDSIAKLGFKTPTPIQHKAIPIGLEGKDMIGIAQTGTGKTMAFAIPMIQRLASGVKGRGLILVPTRELALQVEESVIKIANAFGIRTAVLIGGDPIERQIRALAKHPRVLIATPGRLNDLMKQRKVNVGDVHILVLDEADRMLDMGFAPQIDLILQSVPKDRQTMFFSAIQQPGQVKLTLIRGDGLDGVTYMLSSTEHVAGRTEGALLFPDDALLSPRHCNFICRDVKLFVRDEGSVNGIFVRIIRPQQVPSGSYVLVGEQLLKIETPAPEQPPLPDAEGTYFYASPKRPSRIILTQILAGGHLGLVFRARDEVVSVGRESNDINFPDDPFISGRHATIQAIESPESRLVITDLGSKNGTFVRIHEESPLLHGDYVFIGQQLLRVEIS